MAREVPRRLMLKSLHRWCKAGKESMVSEGSILLSLRVYSKALLLSFL